MDPAPGQPLKVLSVVGAGRSGTTVLASILGEVDGFVGAGELRWLWERGVVAGRPCGCGAAPLDCPVWAPVITRTLAGLGRPATTEAVADVVAAQHEVAHWRSYPRLLRTVGGDDRGWEALRLVREVTAAACAALAVTTGARVIVDTSKRPADAAVLAGIPGIDLYVLHLVRDPRAVVHSWRRAKEYTAGGQTGRIGTRGLAATVRRWTSNGLWAEALRLRLPATRWMFLRYEDLVVAPRPAVERILTLVHETGPAPFTDDRTVTLHPNHIVAGNPNRFTTGSVAIRADDEWRRVMPERDQRLVGLMTLPLALRYGYRPFVQGGAR